MVDCPGCMQIPLRVMQSSAFILTWRGLCVHAHMQIMVMIIINGNFKRVQLTDIAAAPLVPQKLCMQDITGRLLFQELLSFQHSLTSHRVARTFQKLATADPAEHDRWLFVSFLSLATLWPQL